jgi:hypothetical protein
VIARAPILCAYGTGLVPTGGLNMSASVVSRAWAWRTFVWAGIVASLVAWAWVWFRLGGAWAIMLLVAIAAVVLAYRATAGMRSALGGVMVAGFAMFLASLYAMYMLLLEGSPKVTSADVIALSVLPLVGAVILLLGAAVGFRQANT